MDAEGTGETVRVRGNISIAPTPVNEAPDRHVHRAEGASSERSQDKAEMGDLVRRWTSAVDGIRLGHRGRRPRRPNRARQDSTSEMRAREMRDKTAKNSVRFWLLGLDSNQQPSG